MPNNKCIKVCLKSISMECLYYVLPSLRQASPDFRAESLLKVPRVVGILVQENFVCIQGRRMTSAALHLADEKS